MNGGGEGQLSRDELRAGVSSLSRRLDKHLRTWDEGDGDAVFDVAAVTRTLLSNGRGDKALARLCSQERLAPPKIHVDYQIPREAEVRFSFGGFPADPDGIMTRTGWIGTIDPGFGVLRDGTADQMPQSWRGPGEIDVFRWLTTPFVSIKLPTQRHREVTWEKLVSSFGNAYGAHLGVGHPEELSQIRLLSGHGRSLAEHALWLSASVALNALAELLPQIGEQPPRRRKYEHPVASLRSVVMMSNESAAWQHFAVSLGSGLGKAELLRTPFADKMLIVNAERTVGIDGTVSDVVSGSYS
ncbi:hypothetical protein [Microbacterium saperdae]|uniref:Uncharacterized protein n=1 Tax=Microbacterium saperdae TaxID=69368 RepID=A0A543BQU3_9MICO|nr:hypothetical protein [Microbacterium saperdae]TQL87191.1 hypothetical protein FB560_2858 [Microbacterium saperdae]GGM42179.1 hypothetical protein GCM10010489_11580 [Microbacterium saperdae]